MAPEQQKNSDRLRNPVEKVTIPFNALLGKCGLVRTHRTQMWVSGDTLDTNVGLWGYLGHKCGLLGTPWTQMWVSGDTLDTHVG